MAPRQRDNTQRERLLRAMIETADRHGYAGATVSEVIAHAGMSRPTFYEHFPNRDACFKACITHAQEQMMQGMDGALDGVPPRRALACAVEALVSYATADPTTARFLMAESMGGGPSALDVRDQAFARAAAAVVRAQRGSGEEEPLPDVDPRVALGGVCRLLATRLRRGESALSMLSEDLLVWLGCFERPAGQCRWRTLASSPPSPLPPKIPTATIEQSPGALPPGRPRLPVQEIATNHRLRILNAAARLAKQKGYLATTITDLTKLAGIDGAVFYRHFTDKYEAFSAVHEFGFQLVMETTSKAFFAEVGWPRRSWEAIRALSGLMQENPLIAHVGFVEAYTLGPVAVQRIEDSHLAFMFFLQEGLLQGRDPPLTSRVGMEATVAAAFEILYIAIRGRGKLQAAGTALPMAHLWLTPFLGLEPAETFLDIQMNVEAPDQRTKRRH